MLDDDVVKPQPGQHLRSGFFFGLGFCIPFVVAWTLAVVLGMLVRQSMSLQYVDKPFSPFSGLEIVSDEPMRSEGNLIIKGQIANHGSDSWDSVRIAADLLDGEGEFVWQCRDFLWGSIHPNETVNFILDCDGSPGDPLPEFDTYDIDIVDASYVAWVKH